MSTQALASDTTRSRVLELAREAPRSVSELARALDVTSTAVRKHIDRLRADGFVEARGTRKGKGRPATLYALTEEGEALFRQGHEAILGALLAAVHDQMDPDREREVVRRAGGELARRMLADRGASRPDGFEACVRLGKDLLSEMGGRERVRRSGEMAEFIGFSCPLGDYVDEFPVCCDLVAGFLEELLAVPVRPRCPRDADALCLLQARMEGP